MVCYFETAIGMLENKCEKMRADMLLAHSTEDSLVTVLNVIFSSPTYSKLKSKLLDWYEPTMSAIVSKLLHPQCFLRSKTF